MRRALHLLYDACGWLGGLFLIAICGFVLYAVGGSLFGYVAASADDFAGYCMAASAFLALAHTFGKNEHIRVTLVLQRLRGRVRRAAEIYCLVVGGLLAFFLAWYSIRLCYVSWKLNDVSTGLVAVPLWIPQIGMAVGASALALAMLERLADVLRGAPVETEAAPEDLHMER